MTDSYVGEEWGRLQGRMYRGCVRQGAQTLAGLKMLKPSAAVLIIRPLICRRGRKRDGAGEGHV